MPREIRLAARPVGLPKPSDFELVELPEAQPAEGELLVQNLFMSVDPYMRGRMNDVKSYTPPFALGKALEGGAVGRVEQSRHPQFTPGEIVTSNLGWRDRFVSDGRGLGKVDAAAAPPTAYLGVLGGTGLTAYVGLLDIGKPKPGETVFVSAAAGAVGSIAGQIAKIAGCRVVGSAGTPAKIAYLRDELGFDAAIDYHAEPLEPALARHCPDGIDVYFDNVGGDHLQAALALMNPFGRIPACGMISQYNNSVPAPGPNNLTAIVRSRLTVQGFIISDHLDRRPAFLAEMTAWLREGKVKHRETVVNGLEQAPAALIGLLQGENIGKMLVKVGE
ncbi:MAG TPA: NADP-dependent oxidoreductase [Dehalococcoidia bacterium]|nr:NADP-dependent oxidoreductase [Dehalococcoidia bacterium]